MQEYFFIKIWELDNLSSMYNCLVLNCNKDF